ncbi:hypothetical protein ABC304_04575 [Microbacterium sp. 1P10UB]|uniref:hypothetical protein n=1 Tax=unclassified Microbacterium TaxID=2609290 RepID=UPI0039A0BCC0
MTAARSAPPVLLLRDGPHGVAVYEREVAAAVTRSAAVPTAPFSAAEGLPAGVPVHVHFTDRLWGGNPEEAATAFLELAARHPVSVTLHDVPQASDGERNRPRRGAAYRAVAQAARGIVVNSEHERLLLAEEGVWIGATAVIPLPVDLMADAAARPPAEAVSTPDVGVLGYFYPGKGHDEALAAARAAGLHALIVLGRASDGHAEDLAAFVARGRDAGVAVSVTGWLDDAAMAERCRSVGVPVVAHRHVSASGSLASWIGYGRRPISVANRYVREMAALRPGALTVVEEDELTAAVQAAASDPSSTWHGLTEVPGGLADVAAAYLRWWDEGMP